MQITMSGPQMSDADIQQMVSMCRTLFGSPDENERERAKQALSGFSIAAANLQPFLSILPRSTDQYFLQFVTQSLRRIVTRHWRQLTHPTDPIAIRDTVLKYLSQNGPILPQFIIASFAHLLARVCKLAWNSSSEIRQTPSSIAELMSLSLPHTVVALVLWRELVDEMGSAAASDTAGRSTDLSYSEARKASVNFSASTLLLIAQSALEPLYQFYRGDLLDLYRQRNNQWMQAQGISPETAPPSLRAVAVQQVAVLVRAALETVLRCLQFDFMGLSPEAHVEDATVIVLSNARLWRTTLEEPDLTNMIYYICRGATGRSVSGFGHRSEGSDATLGSLGGEGTGALGEDEDVAALCLQLLTCLASVRSNVFSNAAIRMRLLRNICVIAADVACDLMQFSADLGEFKLQEHSTSLHHLCVLLFRLKCNLAEYELVNLWHPALATALTLTPNQHYTGNAHLAALSQLVTSHQAAFAALGGPAKASAAATRRALSSDPACARFLREAVMADVALGSGSGHGPALDPSLCHAAPLATVIPQAPPGGHHASLHLFLSVVYTLTLTTLRCPDPAVTAAPAVGYLLHFWAKLANAVTPHYLLSLPAAAAGGLDRVEEEVEELYHALTRPRPSILAGDDDEDGGNAGGELPASMSAAAVLQSRDTGALFVLDLILPKVMQTYLSSRLRAILAALRDQLALPLPIDLDTASQGAAAAMFHKYAQGAAESAAQARSGNLDALRKLCQYDLGAADAVMEESLNAEQLSCLPALARFQLRLAVDLIDAYFKALTQHYLSALSALDNMRGAVSDSPTTLLVDTATVPLAFVAVDDGLDSPDANTSGDANVLLLSHPTSASPTAISIAAPMPFSAPLVQEYVGTLTALELLLATLLSLSAAILAPDVLPASRKTLGSGAHVPHEETLHLESVLVYHCWLVAGILPLRAGVFTDNAQACSAVFSAHALVLSSPQPTAAAFAAMPNWAPLNAQAPIHNLSARVLALLASSLSPSLPPAPPRTHHFDNALLLFLRAFQHRFCGLAAMRVFRATDREGPILRAASAAMGAPLDCKGCVELMVALTSYATAYWAPRADPWSLMALNASVRALTGRTEDAVLFSPLMGVLDPRTAAGGASSSGEIFSATVDTSTAPARTVDNWLQLLLELTTGYATVQSLSSMRAVRWLLGMHTAHMLSRSHLYQHRQRWSECLARMVLRQGVAPSLARELLYPLDVKFGTLSRQLQLSQLQPQARALLMGLFSDITGVLRACDNKQQYGEVLAWLCPHYTSLIVRACESCWGDAAVVEAGMGLLAELVDNRNNRAVFDSSSLAPYRLVKDITTVATAYALRAQTITAPRNGQAGPPKSAALADDGDSDDEVVEQQIVDAFGRRPVAVSSREAHAAKLRGSALAFSAVSKLLTSSSAPLASFVFHGDAALNGCIAALLRLLSTIDSADVLATPDLATAAFDFFEVVSRKHPRSLAEAEPDVFAALLELLSEGVDRFIAFPPGHPLSALGSSTSEGVLNLVSFLLALQEQTKTRERDVLFAAAPPLPSDLDVLIAGGALSAFLDHHLSALPDHPQTTVHAPTAVPLGPRVDLSSVRVLTDGAAEAAQQLPRLRSLLALPRSAAALQSVFLRVAHYFLFDSSDAPLFVMRVLLPLVHAFPQLWVAYNQLLAQHISPAALAHHRIEASAAREKLMAEAALVTHAAAACFAALGQDEEGRSGRLSMEVWMGNSPSGVNGATALKGYRAVALEYVTKPSV